MFLSKKLILSLIALTNTDVLTNKIPFFSVRQQQILNSAQNVIIHPQNVVLVLAYIFIKLMKHCPQLEPCSPGGEGLSAQTTVLWSTEVRSYREKTAHSHFDSMFGSTRTSLSDRTGGEHVKVGHRV